MVPSTDTATTMFVAEDIDDGPKTETVHTCSTTPPPTRRSTRGIPTPRASPRPPRSTSRRAEDRTHCVVTIDEATEMMRAGTPLPLQPLVGGLPPETAWRYLRTVTDDVVPRVAHG